jgi:tetratricopeptide (TPR) repeat protein
MTNPVFRMGLQSQLIPVIGRNVTNLCRLTDISDVRGPSQAGVFMSRSIIGALFLTLLIPVGCSQSSNGNSGTITGVSNDVAGSMNSHRNPFETSEDPPLTADTHFAAGQLAETQGDFAGAVKQYKEALKVDPKHKRSLYRQAICLSQVKKFPEAVASWKKYIEATGGEANGYSNLGFCHELAGQIDEAESAYLRGIERESKNVACRTNYGLMLARLGRTAEATLQLQAVLTPAEVHYNLASVLEHQNRKEAAKAEYRKAIELDPNLVDAQTRLSALQ